MPAMISYAQNHEDVILHRAFPKKSGFYIDIGAAHPIGHSVTKWFYDQGWSGINVEPLDEFFHWLNIERTRDINLKLCVSNHSGVLTFYEVPSCIGWATMEEEAAASIRGEGKELLPRTVQALTLKDICERYVGERGIDFLKIDVEGHEKAVIEGADFSRWRPRVLVIEATEIGKPLENHRKWESLVFEAGYVFANFDGLNRYYARSEEPELLGPLKLPANVFDDFISFEHFATQRDLEKMRERVSALESLLESLKSIIQEPLESIHS